MRRYVVLLVFLGSFLGIVLLMALRRQAPDVPADELHLVLGGRETECMSCHAADGGSPRGPNHPFGTECHRCHVYPGR